MKKQVLFVAAMFATSLSFAQSGEITSNRGENWLSESGDIGVTFTATPFLDYFGNMFNGNLSNDAPSATWLNSSQMAIEVKKLKDSNTAYRGKIRLGFGSTTDKELVMDVNDPDETVEDKEKTSQMNIVLGAGLEKRVGSSRVVGVYGAEAYIMFGTSKDKFEYGNDISDVGGSRLIEDKSGSTFGLGAGVFGGVEWFFAPKMSLGAEYTWGLMFSSTGNGEMVTEVDGASDITTESGGGSSFGIDNGVTGADIKFTFYFQ